MSTQNTIIRLQLLRAKQAEGTLTREDLLEAITLLRESRFSAASRSAAAKRSAPPAVNADALLNELEGL